MAKDGNCEIESESVLKLLRQSHWPLCLLLQLCMLNFVPKTDDKSGYTQYSFHTNTQTHPPTHTHTHKHTHAHIVMKFMYSAWQGSFCFTIARPLQQLASLPHRYPPLTGCTFRRSCANLLVILTVEFSFSVLQMRVCRSGLRSVLV